MEIFSNIVHVLLCKKTKNINAKLQYITEYFHCNKQNHENFNNCTINYVIIHIFVIILQNKGLCRRTALRYTIGIFGLCCTAPLCELTNIYFSIAVAPLNAYFVYLGM